MPSVSAADSLFHPQQLEPFPQPYTDASSNDGSIEDNLHSAPIPVPKPRSRRNTAGRSLLQEIAQEEDQRTKQATENEKPPSQQRVAPKRDSRFPRLRTSLAGFVLTENAVIDSSTVSAQDGQRQRDAFGASPRFCTSPIRVPSPGSVTSPTRPDSPRSRSYNLERPPSSRRSRRATSNSSSWSPAGAFLSQWSSRDQPAVAGPDDAGREIGDKVKYIIGGQIGYGGFSVIKEVYTMDDSGHKIRRAVKIVRKHVDGTTAHENDIVQLNFEHERSLWKPLNHRYILTLLEDFDDSFATYCIMHVYPRGTLHDLVAQLRRRGSSISLSSMATSHSGSVSPKPNRLPLAIAKRYIFQLACALRYLHEDRRIVHRDVKLENCLISVKIPGVNDEYGNILLGDFGLAEHLDTGPNSTYFGSRPTSGALSMLSAQYHAQGSLQYAAPELLLQAAPQCFAPCVDIWALGVACYTLLTLRRPFDHDLDPKVREMILRGDCDFDGLRDAVVRSFWADTTAEEEEDGYSDEERGAQFGVHDDAEAEADRAVELVRGCLERDVSQRWNVRNVLGCSFLRGCDELYYA